MHPVVDVVLEPSLRYTETIESGAGNRPVRYCRLVADEDTPVGELEVHSFRWRFGAVAVDAEGIGGVEVQPSFRRRGHMGRLLRQTLEHMSRRVTVAAVSDGIQGVYEKFGFATSVAEGHLDLRVRDVERAAAGAAPATARVRPGSTEDLPAMVDLYNSTHAHRPWTHERPADWNRLVPQTTWRPGSEILVVEAEGMLAGYAIMAGRSFGDGYFGLTVQEMAASDADVALCLLADVAVREQRSDLSERSPLSVAFCHMVSGVYEPRAVLGEQALRIDPARRRGRSAWLFHVDELLWTERSRFSPRIGRSRAFRRL